MSAIVVLALLVSGCAVGVSTPTPAPTAKAVEAHECRFFFRDLDERVAGAGVADGLSARLDGYPYLRINRFLASQAIKPEPGDIRFDAWVERLRILDLQARRYELHNLGGTGAVGTAETSATEARIERCGNLLIRAELQDPLSRQQLLEAAWVADDYSLLKRAVGLYPFTSLPFNAGVKRLHTRIHADFLQPLEALPVTGRLTRYVPPAAVIASQKTTLEILERAAGGPGPIPALSDADRQSLFDAFAPVFEVDVASDDDRLGMPVLGEHGLASVDITRPVVYRRISHTRFEGKTLLQLNYSIWFRARPADGDLDLLAGHMDGITFRVTLGSDGRVLMYDSMHNCGCYHLFVPSERLQARAPSRGHEEPPLVPQQVLVSEGRAVVRIAHGTHYLQRVYFDTVVENGMVYALDDDDTLRSLPLPDGGQRSLFRPDGLVSGTRRAERWLFWPMGIAEPGSMRQWGHHATAFVGERHFDDPDLIERYFSSRR